MFSTLQMSNENDEKIEFSSTIGSSSDTLFSSLGAPKSSSLVKPMFQSRFHDETESTEKRRSIPISSRPTKTDSTSTSNANSRPDMLNLNRKEAGKDQIDQILARLEQDNKILAELERSRTTVGE